LKQLHLLTGLRGLAALIVFISHAADKGHISKIFGWGFGQIGVMIFFVLSGFLMSHLYIQKEASYANVHRYALARIARVVPLFLLALCLSYLISNYINPDFTYNFQNTSEFFRALFFIHAPYVFWTIPVEIQFYVVFIVFWWLYQKKASPLVLAAFMALSMLPSIIVYALYEKLPEVFSAYSYAFFIGVVTALLYRKMENNVSIKTFADWAGLPFLILLFINLPDLKLALGLASDNIYLRTWAEPTNWFVIYGLFVCALYGSKSLSFLAWKPFVFLGEISYGLYLLHYPLIVHLNIPQIGATANLLLAFALTIMIAYLSFRFFEKPVSQWIRNSSMFEKRSTYSKTTL